jgi:MHS family proline/betaine transporter-like MFS transporter
LLYVSPVGDGLRHLSGDVPHPGAICGFRDPYNVSTSIFGGTAPAVNDWLIQATGDKLVPTYYMMAACLVGLVALVKVPETARNGTSFALAAYAA